MIPFYLLISFIYFTRHNTSAHEQTPIPKTTQKFSLPQSSMAQLDIETVLELDMFRDCFVKCKQNQPFVDIRMYQSLEKDTIENLFSSLETFVERDGFDSRQFLLHSGSLNTSIVAFNGWLNRNSVSQSRMHQFEFVSTLFETMTKAANDITLYNLNTIDHVILRKVIHLSIKLLFMYPYRQRSENTDILCAVKRMKTALNIWTEIFNENHNISPNVQQSFDVYHNRAKLLIYEIERDSLDPSITS